MSSKWENEIQRHRDEELDKAVRMLQALEEIRELRVEILKKYWPRIFIVGKTFAKSIDKEITRNEEGRYTIGGYNNIEVGLDTGFRKDGSISSQIIIEYHSEWRLDKAAISIDQFNETLLAKKLIGVYEGKIDESVKELTAPYIQEWERKKIKKMMKKRKKGWK